MTANHRPLEEGDIELIDRVQATPCLYNTKDPNFRLVYKKEQEWQSIAEGLAMSDWEARKRWTVLRDRYARELKQLILHPDSMEYGRNDFFIRMDFLRNFVKKREVKRKRINSMDIEVKEENMAGPIRLRKSKCDGISLDSDEVQGKLYATDDSQYSSNVKFSYVEQMSQEPVDQVQHHENDTVIDQACGDEEFNDYVEDTSVTYEPVDEDQQTLHRRNSENCMLSTSQKKDNGNIIIKPEGGTVENDLCIATFGENRIVTLPQLQQRPMITEASSEVALPTLPIDIEDYFSKTIALYLRQLHPRLKIKAKIEIMQIIEKYIDLQESES